MVQVIKKMCYIIRRFQGTFRNDLLISNVFLKQLLFILNGFWIKFKYISIKFNVLEFSEK